MLDKYETFSEESIESAVVFYSMAPLFLSHRPARKMHLYHSPVRSSQIPAQMALLCSLPAGLPRIRKVRCPPAQIFQ